MSSINVFLSPSVAPIWFCCYKLGHQMKITSDCRRVFPTLEFVVTGLDSEKLYAVSVHMDLADDKILRYVAGVVHETVSTEKKDPPKIVFHGKGVQTGAQWMDSVIDFDQVRITNKKSLEGKNENTVHLHPRHRYVPVITIYEGMEPIHTARLPETVFNVVTMYQNNELSEYKTSQNKYSTGSRPENREKRKRVQEEGTPMTVKKTKKEECDAPVTPSMQIIQDVLDQLQKDASSVPLVVPPMQPLPKPQTRGFSVLDLVPTEAAALPKVTPKVEDEVVDDLTLSASMQSMIQEALDQLQKDTPSPSLPMPPMQTLPTLPSMDSSLFNPTSSVNQVLSITKTAPKVKKAPSATSSSIPTVHSVVPPPAMLLPDMSAFCNMMNFPMIPPMLPNSNLQDFVFPPFNPFLNPFFNPLATAFPTPSVTPFSVITTPVSSDKTAEEKVDVENF